MDDFRNAIDFKHSHIIIIKQMLSSISRCALNDYNFFMEKQKQTKMKVLLIVSFSKKKIDY